MACRLRTRAVLFAVCNKKTHDASQALLMPMHSYGQSPNLTEQTPVNRIPCNGLLFVSEADPFSSNVLQQIAKRLTCFSAPLLVLDFAPAKHRRPSLRSSEVTWIASRLSKGTDRQPRKAFRTFCAAGEYAISHSLGDQGSIAPAQHATPAYGEAIPRFAELLADKLEIAGCGVDRTVHADLAT